MSYVLDTEDIFKRAKRAREDARDGALRTLRHARFQAWLNMRAHVVAVQQQAHMQQANALLQATAG